MKLKDSKGNEIGIVWKQMVYYDWLVLILVPILLIIIGLIPIGLAFIVHTWFLKIVLVIIEVFYLRALAFPVMWGALQYVAFDSIKRLAKKQNKE